MKKVIIFSIIALVFSASVFSQPGKDDQRTIETKIADLLMKLPSQSSDDQDKIMAELAALGELAVAGIADNLVAPGNGDDVALRYAISGLVKYVTKCDDKEQMKRCSQAICKVIGNAKDDEVKDFLLQELQYVAGDETVPVVSAYLLSGRLCDPAARVLVRINSGLAENALDKVLPKAGVPQQIILAEAIGQVRYEPAAEKLRALATTSDRNLKKTVLRSLAEIGDMQSSELLASEAKKTGYSFEPTDAAGSYLLFLKRTAENGNRPFAEKACKKIIKNEEIPVHTRSAALRILAESKGIRAVPVLLQAVKSTDKDYRMAAQALLGEQYSSEISAALQKIAKSTKNTELQSELIYLFSEKNDKSAFPLILKSLESKDRQVQLIAIKAAAKTGQSEAIVPIAAMMKTGDNEIIAAAQTALLTIEGEGVADAAASFIPQVSGAARCALIEIISKRGAVRYAGLIFDEVGNSDPQIKLTAEKALSSVVKSGDGERIAGLLNNASAKNEISALQDALFPAIQYSGNKSEQVATILALMKKAGDKQSRYYNIFAKTGGSEALAIVEKEFETGSLDQKEAALKVLFNWSDFTALEALYRISKSNPSGKFHDVALTSYISGIDKSENTTDQKVLMFRKAMELSNAVDQKKQILQGIAKNSTLLSLVFVAKYLDNNDLQQTAMQAVSTIVLANKQMYGPVVEEIVGKAIALDKSADANSRKQALLKYLTSLPKENGYVSMFNAKDLTGWKGLVGNPITRQQMKLKKLAEEQKKADELMRLNWKIENGVVYYVGEGHAGEGGDNLCSEKMYEDFELILDWRMEAKGDGGVYLRGTPQVQIWDPENPRKKFGEHTGSGGLHNNQKGLNRPLVVADNPINEWNTFRIKMVGEKVTVYLNGQLVVDNLTLENFWSRNLPIFDKESIELQAHGTRLEYRNIYVREIPRPKPYSVSKEEAKEEFVPLFNGINLDGWTDNLADYFAHEGMIVCQPSDNGSGNLFTGKEYSDFIMRFEFQLTPGANNGLGIRMPMINKAVAYEGIELQILDNEAEIYKNLKPYQYHGSVYGVIPAKRGFLKPVGEWNFQEVQALGSRIKVILNGEVILDGDIAEASKNGTETIDKREHPGLLNKTGHIGFMGHGAPLKFRNLRIKDMSKL